MLGVQPALGRFFHASDEHGPNSAPYIVLSDAFWRSRFHADPHVVRNNGGREQAPVHHHRRRAAAASTAPNCSCGRTSGCPWSMRSRSRALTILDLPSQSEPLGSGSAEAWRDRAAGDGKPERRSRSTRQTIPRYKTKACGARLVKPGLMGDVLGDATRAFLFGILLLSFLVLVAACANLASIFAARAADRSRELAIRLAIGSSRWHILRQLLTEAVLVSLAGGIVGTAFAAVLLRLLTRWQPFSEYPVHVTVNPDIRVYALALLLSLASGLLFGLLPARQIWRTDAAQVIKGSAAAPALFRRLTLRDLLLGIQIALCTLLVTASLVALRGMQHSLARAVGLSATGRDVGRRAISTWPATPTMNRWCCRSAWPKKLLPYSGRYRRGNDQRYATGRNWQLHWLLSRRHDRFPSYQRRVRGKVLFHLARLPQGRRDTPDGRAATLLGRTTRNLQRSPS